MYVLDSDTLSLVHSGSGLLNERVAKLDPVEVGVSLVTRIEILRARFDFVLKAADGEQLLRAQFWLHQSEQLLSRYSVVSFDENSAAELDRLRAIKKLKKIGRADLLIASVVLANRAVLVTRNLKHFRQIPGLKVENWAN